MSDLISKAAAIQAVFDWEQGKISGTIADAIAAIPATDAREAALREAAAVARKAWRDGFDPTPHILALIDKPAPDAREAAQAQARAAWRIAGMVTNNDEALQVHEAICALFSIGTEPPEGVTEART